MHAPTYSHWATVKCILCCLQGTTSYGLHITHNSSFALHDFMDVDWVGSIDDHKSTDGYLVFFGYTSISWKSSKQCTIARSSTKAEYKALANGTTEVIWLQYLLADLQIIFASAPTIWCDNLGVTYLSAIPIFHGCNNMLRLIIILYKIGVRRKRFKFILSLLRINLQMSLLSHFLLLLILLFGSSFELIFHPQLLYIALHV